MSSCTVNMDCGSFVCVSVFQSVLSGYLGICYHISLGSLTVVYQLGEGQSGGDCFSFLFGNMWRRKEKNKKKLALKISGDS